MEIKRGIDGLMIQYLGSRFDFYCKKIKTWIHMKRGKDNRFSDVPPDFLIIGLQKSGTTWLVSLLSEHPDIAVVPTRPGQGGGIAEGHFFDTLAKRDSDAECFRSIFTKKHNALFSDLVKSNSGNDLFARRYNAFLGSYKKSQGKTLVGDKTTEYVFFLDLIDSMYPGIKKICILRDPRDRMVSFHFHQLRKKKISNYNISIEDVQNYTERMLEEICCLLEYQGDIHFMTYEDLSRDPAAETKKMLSYLQTNHDDPLINNMVDKSCFERKAGRKRGTSDIQSHFRKGIIGDWNNHLSADMSLYITKSLEGPLKKLQENRTINIQSYYAYFDNS